MKEVNKDSIKLHSYFIKIWLVIGKINNNQLQCIIYNQPGINSTAVAASNRHISLSIVWRWF